MSRRQGQQIENIVADFLTAKGCKLMDRNYQFRGGEIDLIVKDGKHLCFVEVRFRKNVTFGSAAESVNWGKQQKILRTAEHYLLNKPKIQNLCCRFDVIACSPDTNGQLSIDWIKDAFTA